MLCFALLASNCAMSYCQSARLLRRGAQQWVAPRSALVALSPETQKLNSGLRSSQTITSCPVALSRSLKSLLSGQPCHVYERRQAVAQLQRLPSAFPTSAACASLLPA